MTEFAPLLDKRTSGRASGREPRGLDVRSFAVFSVAAAVIFVIGFTFVPRQNAPMADILAATTTAAPKGQLVLLTAATGLPGIAASHKRLEREGSLASTPVYRKFGLPESAVILEPFIDTTFSLLEDDAEGVSVDRSKTSWKVERLDADQAPRELNLKPGGSGVVASGSGAVFIHKFEELGLHRISYGLALPGEQRRTSLALVRYVRREFRKVSEEDRMAVMEAFRVMAETTDARGTSLYGPNFRSLRRLSSEHNNWAGRQDCDHLHDGMGYIPLHLAITRQLEASLQAVDPTVALPYWEYTYDVEKLKANNMTFWDNWGSIELFSDEWFGRTNLDTGVLEGDSYFKNLNVSAATGNFTHVTNSYGLIRSPWNNDPGTTFRRYIGARAGKWGDTLENSTHFGQGVSDYANCGLLCEAINSKTLSGFSLSIPGLVHGSIHLMTGGSSILGHDPSSSDKWAWVTDEQVKTWATQATWGVIPRMGYRYGYWDCPETCSLDTPREECACSCDTTNEYYHGIDTEYACDSSFILGDAATSSGANDPSFWSMHGTLERYFQFALAKGWMESLAWPNCTASYSNCVFEDNLEPPTITHCRGHDPDDLILFGEVDGMTLTNLEYVNYLADAAGLPYVYDSFEWDFCSDLAGIDIEECGASEPSTDRTELGGPRPTDAMKAVEATQAAFRKSAAAVAEASEAEVAAAAEASEAEAAVEAAVESSGAVAPTSLSSSDSSSSSSKKPHIILFTVDDMGWNDVGWTSTDIPEATEYMVKLAEKSVKLTHYYTQPSCTPSRVTIMTGKWAYRNGFQNHEVQPTDQVGVPLSNKLMPEILQELGYKTHGFGKWNIGHCNEAYLPQERGFNHFLGYLGPGHGYRTFDSGFTAGVKDMIEGFSELFDAADAESGQQRTSSWTTGSAYEGQYDTELYRDFATDAVKRHAALMASSSSGSDSETPLFMWCAQHGIHAEYDSDPIPPDSMLSASNKKYLETLDMRMRDTVTSDDDDDDDDDDDGGSSSESGPGSGSLPGADSGKDEEERFFKMRKITASVLMSIDNSLKHLVQTLDEVGMLQDSVVFVHSDNGGDTEYNKGHPGNNFPLRSEKFAYYEGGIRVPAFVFAPGFLDDTRKGSTFHGLMHHVDLLTTFLGLAGADVEKHIAEHGLDGHDMWKAINGEVTGPRQELVLNLPRSTTWTVGENKTHEGVALRVGAYKLLLNHPVDYWFSPNPGPDHHYSSDMMAAVCQYDFYAEGTDNGRCEYTNFLFDLATDPHERNNLWSSDDHQEIRASLIARAEELVALPGNSQAGGEGDQPPDYGEIVYEFYHKTPHDAPLAFVAAGNYIVPWNCETIA